MSASSSPSPNSPNVDQPTLLWQKEVEAGFNSMVVKIYPMINQVDAAHDLLKKATELESSKL